MAQTADDRGTATGFGDIIVTAQKRSQLLSDVGMSITAQTGESLQTLGISNAGELTKVVPGLVVTPQASGNPVYTLRGIGFYDSGMAAPPAVSLYIDEVPLAFPLYAEGTAFDLERVEVLKGPQGTLFGSNSTGGAINFIAAKPTDTFQTGAIMSWSRFNLVEGEGFVSGPLSDKIKVRLAARGESGGAWQYSVSRPDDTNGAKAKVAGRFLLDWDPSETVRFRVNLNGYSDKGDIAAPQFIDSVVLPTSMAPQWLNDFINNYTPIPNDARKADWWSGRANKKDMRFLQAALRSEVDLSANVMLTSITSYQDFKVNNIQELAGLPINNQGSGYIGGNKSFNQELRLSGDTGRLNWLVGGSYEWLDSNTRWDMTLPELTVSWVFPPELGLPSLRHVEAAVHQKIKNYAAFANAEYKITDQLTFQAGIRYTKSDRSALSCDRDIATDENGNPTNETGINFTYLQGVLMQAFGIPGDPVPIGPGQCYALGSLEDHFAPDLNGTPGTLNQDNVSWSLGLNYKFDNGPLLYANYRRGYKAGAFITTTPSVTSQWTPITQERVDAYEAGFKAPLADGRVSLNAAAFYYNYKDKQTGGRIWDPIFNLMARLINVPKSTVWGIEGEVQASPVDGLTLNASGLYLKSKIKGEFFTYSQSGLYADFGGSPLPYAPNWTANFDAQYEGAVTDSVNAFVGGHFSYQGKTYTTFTSPAAPSDDFAIQSYGLLDLRAGIADPDGSWRLMLFARNVTDKYYTTLFGQGSDTQYRYAGMPRVFGVQLTLRPGL